MNERQADRIMAYFDRWMGAHSGRYPEVQYHCPLCLSRVGTESPGIKTSLECADGEGNVFSLQLSRG